MAETLSQLSNDMAELVEESGAYIVRVEARRRLPASGVVWSSDGLIVTSHHVVERDDNIKVGLPNGDTVDATLVGRDPTTDIAVLRVQTSGLNAPTWANPDSLRVGQIGLALGRPGKSVLATLGIVSALGDSWRAPTGGLIDRYLQTDVTMYPGFSGGPLVNANGEAVGINTSALLRGISLVVTTPTLRRVVDTLVTHGKIRRGYLGVGAQPARLPENIAQQVGQETGLLLASVESGSPADNGGLVLGDTIVSVNGQTIRGLDELAGVLSGDNVSKSVTVKVVRGGSVLDLTVTVGERD